MTMTTANTKTTLVNTLKRTAAAVGTAGGLAAGLLGLPADVAGLHSVIGSGVASADPNVSPATPPPWAPPQPNSPWWAPGSHVVWSPATERWGFWWFNDWYSL